MYGCMVVRACSRPHSSGYGCWHAHWNHCSSKTSALQAAGRPSAHQLHVNEGACDLNVPAVSAYFMLFEPGLDGHTHRRLVHVPI